MHQKNFSFITMRARGVKMSVPTELSVLNYLVTLLSMPSVKESV